nr:PD-(D/E)XK nuclease family protein [uncultured Draconibacterium sp.]
MNLELALKLLNDFKKVPKNNIDTSFLEICSYPKRRFEEICSRILCFYFNPRKEHRLKDLFISSLLELLDKPDIPYQEEQIKIITEDNADGKRIDLVIYSPDFIIGIENKITASLYNPLDSYKKRLQEYNIENTIKLVLSVDKITKKEECELIKSNDFIAITYSEFFEILKRNIGGYISTCNQKYLIQLYDFIQTLENMNPLNPADKKLSEFFFDNSSQIDELILAHENYKERILRIQRDKISELKEQISIKTGKDWWAWQGWDLGFDSFNKNKPRIGIESSFKNTRTSALGEFRIYITTWNLKDWVSYEKILMEKFPNNFLDKVNNRVYLHMDVIIDQNDELILEKLYEYFNLLEKITE